MARTKFFRTPQDLIEGYGLGNKKRGARNVWLDGRILPSGKVSLVKVLPHTVSKGKRSGEKISTGAILIPETSMEIKRQNEEKVRLWKISIDSENVDREREGAGFVPEVKNKVLLLDYIKKVGDNALSETGNRHSVYATMNSLAKHVEAFSGSSTKFEDVSLTWVRNFITYLKCDALNLNFTRTKKEEKKQEKHLSQNSQNRLIRNINFVLNKAVQAHYIARNPMMEVPAKEKVSQKQGTREYLTLEEVKMLINTPFTHSPKSNYDIRNSFLFACFTGLRFSDLKALRKIDFHKDRNGTYISITMIKTKEPLKVYIPEVALQYVPKRDNLDSLVFHLPKNDYSNESLRKWAKDAGIKDKLVTFHVARHTSATLLLSEGVPLAAVQKQLGHTKSQTTEIYAKIVDDAQRKAISKFDDMFGKKKEE